MRSTPPKLIASMLFLIFSSGLTYASERRHGAGLKENVGVTKPTPSTGGIGFKEESKDQCVLDNWSREKLARVRVEAPLISREPMIGSFIRASQDTLIILSERGREVRMPVSSVENFEVSIRRSRNTTKGMLIGLFLMGAYFFPGILLDDANILDHSSASAAIFLTSAVLGIVTKSDQWMEVSPYRLNPAVAITQDKSLVAALSFNF